jgi:hypothetical protein
MDRIRKRYGQDAISRVVGRNFEMYDFNAFNGLTRSKDGKKPVVAESPKDTKNEVETEAN